MDQQTLQDVCLPQEQPTLEPPRTRCAQQLPIDQNDLLVPIARTATTNTINLGTTLNPTPTFTAAEEFERTYVPPPLAAVQTLTQTGPLPTPTDPTQSPQIQTEPPPISTSVWIGIAVGVGVAILLLIVTALIVGVVCFGRKRNSPRTSRRRCTMMERCKQKTAMLKIQYYCLPNSHSSCPGSYQERAPDWQTP